MKHSTTEAVVLGHKNLGEADKIIFLYTKELGKKRVIAKGSRRLTSRFTGHLETFNFINAQLYLGPRNTILTEVTTVKSYLKDRNNYNLINTALEIAEITDKMLFENQEIEGLIPLIEETIKSLAGKEDKNKMFLIKKSFTIKFLDKLGLMPDLKNTSLEIESKYQKFFHYMKTSRIHDAERISLKKDEKNYIEQFTKNLLNSAI